MTCINNEKLRRREKMKKPKTKNTKSKKTKTKKPKTSTATIKELEKIAKKYGGKLLK